MQTDLLRCDGYDIVMQEVPGEVSLAINITECPHHCVGCHSAHLAESYGDYVKDILPDALREYGRLITCVCFMGGDQHLDDLVAQCKYIKDNYPNLKIALYSGADWPNEFEACIDYLDYMKIGKYDSRLGGLDSKDTNQIMLRRMGPWESWEDITHQFWRET